MIKAPAIFFQTNTVLIDDDTIYARLLINKIKTNTRLTILESSESIIEQAKNDFLFTAKPKKADNDKIFHNLYGAIKEQKPIDSPLISIVIADLHLKETTGLDLFTKIESKYVYKILISNFMDSDYNQEIKEAQNNGLIDVVLDKEPGLANTLSKALLDGQIKFFTEISKDIFSSKNNSSPLSDNQSSKYLKDTITRFKPEHIWPNDNLSSFHLVNNHQKKKLFFTDENESETLIESFRAETADKEIIKQIRSGESILCHDDPFSIDGRDWPFYLRKAKKIGQKYRYHAIMEED